ncbi:hypothetical protein KAR48_14715 [bacterium]|nr:hypothetical protein [bacterium]
MYSCLRNRYFLMFCKFTLIVILGGSGISKMIDPNKVVAILFQLSLFPFALLHPLVYSLSVIEIFVAVGLVFLSSSKTLQYVVFFIFGFFFLFSIYAALNGFQGDCGCFGNLINSSFGFGMIFRNLLLLILAYIVLRGCNDITLINWNFQKGV